jgi:uncharacterized membrane protein YbjE (DUF340 family)
MSTRRNLRRKTLATAALTVLTAGMVSMGAGTANASPFSGGGSCTGSAGWFSFTTNCQGNAGPFGGGFGFNLGR